MSTIWVTPGGVRELSRTSRAREFDASRVRRSLCPRPSLPRGRCAGRDANPSLAVSPQSERAVGPEALLDPRAGAGRGQAGPLPHTWRWGRDREPRPPGVGLAALLPRLQPILASDSTSVREESGERWFQEYRLQLGIPRNNIRTLPAAKPNNNSSSKQRNQGQCERPLPYHKLCSRDHCSWGCRRGQHSRSAA